MSQHGNHELVRVVEALNPNAANVQRIVIEPLGSNSLLPSSVDLRLDRFFRVFENHRYPHIDPAADQSDLTRQVEPEGDEPFILHPGEFVLGSTYEVVTLPDDVAGFIVRTRRR